MIRQNYQLDNIVSKATEVLVLWRTERGIIEISKDTLAVPVKLGDQRRGYILHGLGKLLIDAIVETEEGAVGESIEKELNEPFLMLGDPEELQKKLAKASEEDFAKMNYKTQTRIHR